MFHRRAFLLKEDAEYRRREMKRILSEKALEAMTGDSEIDRMSRIIFPCLFMVFNVWYWLYFLSVRWYQMGETNMQCQAGSDRPV